MLYPPSPHTLRIRRNLSIMTQGMAALEDLKDLTACLWRTASLDREDLDGVRAMAARHQAPVALIESCQRIEVYSFGGCSCDAQASLRGFDALLHMASVAAGLHSVVLGEEQVVGQVRAALAEAPPALRELGDVAVAAARELRRNTSFNTHSGHLLDRGLAITGIEPRGAILILGTGHMARLVALRARDLGFAPVMIAGRRKPGAAWFDEEAFRFLPLESLAESPAVEIAVGCLGSDAPLLNLASQLPPVRKLILDLGTPRNFGGSSTTPLLDISALLDAGHRHGAERRDTLMDELRAIIERRLEMARTTRRSPVGSLRASVESVRRREIDRISRLHPEIPGETLDAITRSLVNQLFHLPSERLKHLDDPTLGDRVVALFSEDGPAEPGPRARFA